MRLASGLGLILVANAMAHVLPLASRELSKLQSVDKRSEKSTEKSTEKPKLDNTGQKLLISSDSTTSNYKPNDKKGLQGWGYYAKDILTLNILNLAKAGRSTRLMLEEGEFTKLLDQTSKGSFVVLEFGHNDAVNVDTDDRDRGVLPFVESKTETHRGKKVLSFGDYLRKMITSVKEKGGIPIISGMVARNAWVKGELSRTYPFSELARRVAEDAKIEYLDHTLYTIESLKALGEERATKMYPDKQHTHTDPEGAKKNAEAFAMAILCHCGGDSQLLPFLKNPEKLDKSKCVPCKKDSGHGIKKGSTRKRNENKGSEDN